MDDATGNKEPSFAEKLRTYMDDLGQEKFQVRGHSVTGHVTEEYRNRRYYSLEIATDIYKALFDGLVKQWNAETMFMSSLSEQFEHPAYQRIIAMGAKAVPFILDEMRERPNHWGYALSTITGSNPVAAEDEGKIDHVIAAWLDWGKRQHQYPCLHDDCDLTIAKAIDIHTGISYTDSHGKETTQEEEDQFGKDS